MSGPGSNLVELEQRPDIRGHVTRALRAAVTTGELVPGRVYSAPSLAAAFGVSATPVREAMLDLIREGLVVAVRNKGYRVVEVTDADLDEITALRRLLEPAGVRDAVERMPAGAHEPLRALARATVDAADADDLRRYLELDREFHMALLGHCGNRRLVDLVRELRSQTRLFGMPALAARHQLTATALEHVEIVDLAEAGDADGAEDVMRRHLAHVRGLWGRPET